MQANSSSRNSAMIPLAVGGFHDVWGPANKWRSILDPSGARTTFTFDLQSKTVMESARGTRVTLTSCASQKTVGAAELSHFAAHVEFRAKVGSGDADTPAGAFLGHDESQRHVTVVAATKLRTRSNRTRWLEDVIQQANLQLLVDLRRRKAVFEGDDPARFVRWFRGTSRNAVIDAIRFCLRVFAASGLVDLSDPNCAQPAELVMLRELAGMAGEQIERIRETKLREAMLDLRDGKSIRSSARRLGISKSKVGRMQKRGCRLIAARLGN